jgi:signal transduction histidine kinase
MFLARLKSIRRRLSIRLTLWHSALFIVSAIGLLALTYALLRNRVNATEHYVLESRLNQYASEYRRGGIKAVEHLATLRRGRAQQAFFVRVADAANQTVFLRHADDWAEFSPEKLVGQPMPAAGPRTWQLLPSTDGTKLLIVTERLADGSMLQVGKANEELLDLLEDYRRACLLVLLIVVPASFAGGAFVTSRALRPVQQLTNVVQEIVETDRLDARVPSAGSRDELDALVQLFNRMLGRIETLVRGMRESIDNVAHDLRTPLTRLRHKAQAILRQNPPGKPGVQPETRAALDALAYCVEEADRVNTILTALVDIAEAETGLMKLDVASVQVSRLVDDVVESYADWAEEKNVTLAVKIPPDLAVQADPTALFRVFANVLDNAIKYTPAGGSVEITAAPRQELVVVTFSDTGIGISPEDLPRIWNRHFRSSRGRDQRGLGLGLSFVRAIVNAHGGTATISPRPGGGTIAEIALSAGVSSAGGRSPGGQATSAGG